MNVRGLLILAAVCAISLSSSAQNKLWTGVPVESAKPYIDLHNNTIPRNFRLFRLDRLQADQFQRQASTSQLSPAAVQAAVKFDLPLPENNELTAAMFVSTILSEELQKANPDLKTYLLVNPATNNTAARLTISKMGVSGIILTDKGTVYISPLGPAFPDLHMVYYVKDEIVSSPVSCGIKEDMSNLKAASVLAGDCQKRTFRLAVSATGEYTTWAGSQANALTYITTTVNNLNAIYERDLNINFTLVTNNSILFTNAGSDPYPTLTFPDGATLSTNHTTINTNIGNGNYDLGIVFNNGWNGGLAALGVVCNNSFKGRGAAGLNFGTGANPTAGPQGAIFDGTVAHEIAHQFNASHTFAATNGGCAGNANAATAYEPGGGSTIMAYAGTCSGNAYQNNSDLYFHSGNIAQIQSYATGGSASCSSPFATGNNTPVITVPAASYTIPASTPFTLGSTGTDPDGNTLKYTWEQMDAGTTTTTAPASTNTTGPNFRPYPPSTNPARTFPSIEDILAGISPQYEVLSSVTRTMNFRVTVRDEAAGGGCTAEASVAVNIDGGSGAFLVSSQNGATNWTANGSNTATVTWNVANTTAAPVSCTAVDILFSSDGGLSFPYTLAANTPNDGTQVIVIPSLPTSIGRIKVQARNNIFFNINTGNISISSSCSAEGTVFSPAASVTGNAGNAALDLSLSPVFGILVTPSGQLTAGDPATTLAVRDSASGGPQVFINVFRYDTYTFTVNRAGNYTLALSGVFPTIINLYTGSFNPSSPGTNFITSNGVFSNVTSSTSIFGNITASLTPGIFYTLTVGSFSATQPALPASYTVSVSAAPSGGNLYTGPADPGAGFSYTYVIVDNATGLIKAIDASANLSSSSTYPSGTFTVYGLSHSNSISPATLNAYIGGAFNTLYNDLLYNPASLCGNLSKNTLTATVNAALPVKLLALKVYKTANKTALIKWGTAMEQNNSHFEIQRSSDGLSFSKVLGRVNGRGNSSSVTDYSFTDETPGAQWNYYRIKQVDTDGQASFTNIVRVNFADNYSSVTTYPNPAQSILHIEYNTEKPGQVKWVITDSKGAAVKQAVFTAQSGSNLQQLNVAGLAAGTYLLRTISNNEVLVAKFIKE